MTSQISGPCCDSDIKPDRCKKSRPATNFRRLWRCLSLKETKSSLVSIINILKIINACQDSVKRGKNCTDEWFYFLCGVRMLRENYVKMCGEQGFIAVSRLPRNWITTRSTDAALLRPFDGWSQIWPSCQLGNHRLRKQDRHLRNCFAGFMTSF